MLGMCLIVFNIYDICFAIIQKMFRKLILCLTSALLFILSWPPHGFPILIFLAFVPLFFILDNTQLSKRSKVAFTFLVFVLWNTATTYWIVHASLFGAVMAITVNSLLMTSVILLFLLVKSKFDDRRAWWALLSFWLSFEYVHFNWDLSWPWLTLGNVFSHYPNIIQWYEFTGVLGGSLWVILINILLYTSFKQKQLAKVVVPLIIVPLLVNLFIDSESNGETVNFVVVQPNVDPYYEKFDAISSTQQMNKFIDLAKTKLDSTTDYLIGPETAIVDGIWENNIENATEVKMLRNLIDSFPNMNIIVGASTYKAYTNNEKISSTARKFNGSDTYYDVYNSALHITRTSIDIYHKSKLVQGVEFTPFSFLLDQFEFLTIDLGGISGSLGTQSYRSVFSSYPAKIAPIICYESVFGEYTSNYVKNGANMFAIITNDGWWKDTPGYQQHLHYASLRAIECRRPIARSANTGISAFIDKNGQIISRTNWDEEKAISYSLISNDTLTFFVRYGDYIGRISSFVAIMFILFSVARRKDTY